MIGLKALVARNVKLYFKDKGMFLTSLITPVILLVLYATFLRNVYVDSFRSALDAAGASVPETLVNGCVGGQLISSLLAVSCVTVAFCSNLLMVQDKSSGARHDLTIAPVRPTVLALSYYLASLISALIIALIAASMCLTYLGFTGWYLSAGDVAGLFGGVVLLVLFGTALSSCIVFPLSTQGQASAVGTIVSSGYGLYAGHICPFPASRRGCKGCCPSCPAPMAPAFCATAPCGAALRKCAAWASRRKWCRASVTAWTATSISLKTKWRLLPCI